jgi:hypothetical protein
MVVNLDLRNVQERQDRRKAGSRSGGNEDVKQLYSRLHFIFTFTKFHNSLITH